jgi:UDP-N-acetylmuramate dehydrogenase
MNAFCPEDIRTDEPLAPKTSIGIGGHARYYYEAETVDQFRAVLAWARAQGIPVLILGGGSNILFPDEVIEALVLSIGIRRMEQEDRGGTVRLTVGAGLTWDQVVEKAVARNWAGIECLSGIPGRVGAAPIQNIGAYGQELADVLVSVQALDLATMEEVRFDRQQCGFGYRTSVFKGVATGRYAILSITLDLEIDGKPCLRYPDLAGRLKQGAGLQEVRETVLAVRSAKSMVINAEDPNSRSCGSFFVNPILDEAEYRIFLLKNPGEHPCFPANDGDVKLSAAWLIEHSGFPKGMVRGNVGLSANHCLAVINRGGGTYAEVLDLMAELRAGVWERFSVRLEPEPVII